MRPLARALPTLEALLPSRRPSLPLSRFPTSRRSLSSTPVSLRPPPTLAKPVHSPAGSSTAHHLPRHGAHHPGNGSGGGAGGAGTGHKRPSPHMVWYREIVPATLTPIALALALYLSLTLLRTHLSTERSLAETSARVAQLEADLARVRKDKRRLVERERKERERILPMVVERVLARVGYGEKEEESEQDEGERERDQPRLLV